MKIAVGSQNVAKVKAVDMAAQAYWPGTTVTGFDVESGVSIQPLGHEETLTGALNRAKAAFATGGVDIGVGLEGGVVEIHGTPVMMSYVAVTDGKQEFVVPAHGTPLPHSWGEALKQGAELRPHVIACGLEYDYKTGVNGILTNNVVTRDEAFAMAVKCALAPWVRPEAYANGGKQAA